MQPGPASLQSYWRLVRDNRNFRLLWLAQIVSELGDWLYAVAIYSLLLELTGKASSVALAVVLQTLPQCFASPAAGVVNDRMSRKRIMILSDLTRAVIVLLMLVVRSQELVGLIYVLLFLETTMWAFFEPARNAVVPNVTSGDELLVANAVSATTWSVNLGIGFAIGGAVAVAFGRNTVFVVNALSFLVSASLIRRMRFAEPHIAAGPRLRLRDLADFSPVVEGLKYVAQDRRRLTTLLAKAGLGLMGTNWVILPILGERVFPVFAAGLDAKRAGMLGMSLLMAARGLGSLLGPLATTPWAGRKETRLRSGILYGFLAGAVGYLLLGAAGSIWTALAATILSHAGGSMVWVFSTTLLQGQTEDRFRGRVFSTDYACHLAVMSLSTYLAGGLIDHGMSARTLALLTGVVSLAPAVAWAWALRFWRRA